MMGDIWPGTDSVFPSVQVPGREASGGGGGTSLRELAYEVIDISDGTWTLYDPDGLISGSGNVGGYNVVTWNALASPSADYNWSGGLNCRSPRWYKALTIEGSPVSSMDLGVMSVRMQLATDIDMFSQQVVFGTARDATSTAMTTIAGAGGRAARITGSNVDYGSWQRNSTTIQFDAQHVAGFHSQFFGAGAGGGGAFISTNASGTARKSGTRNNGQFYPTPANLVMIVGVGPRGNNDAIEANDRQKFRLAYRALTFDKGGL